MLPEKLDDLTSVSGGISRWKDGPDSYNLPFNFHMRATYRMFARTHTRVCTHTYSSTPIFFSRWGFSV